MLRPASGGCVGLEHEAAEWLISWDRFEDVGTDARTPKARVINAEETDISVLLRSGKGDPPLPSPIWTTIGTRNRNIVDSRQSFQGELNLWAGSWNAFQVERKWRPSTSIPRGTMSSESCRTSSSSRAHVRRDWRGRVAFFSVTATITNFFTATRGLGGIDWWGKVRSLRTRKRHPEDHAMSLTQYWILGIVDRPNLPTSGAEAL